MSTPSSLANKTLSRVAILDSSFIPIAIIIIGAILRFENIWFSFSIDDAEALKESLQVFPSIRHQFRPVFFIGLHFWRLLGPDADWWIKLIPFIFSLAAVVMAWFVGKRFGGRPTATALCLLMAISPLHLDITAELRMYCLMSALGMAQLLCYFRYREAGKMGFLVGTTIIGTVGMYTHPYYSFYLLGLFVFAYLDRREISFWRFAAALVGIAMLYAPWALVTLSYGKSSLASPFFNTTHPSSAPFKLIAAFTTGFSYFKVGDLGLGAKFGLREVMNNLPLVFMAAAAFGVIAFGAVRQLRQPSEHLSRNAVIALALLPFAIAYCGVLIAHKDFTHAHYHIASLPFVLLFMVKGIQGLNRARVLRNTAIMLYAAVLCISLYNYYFDTQHYGRRADWHQASRLIAQQNSPSKPLLLLAEKEGMQGTYPYLDRYADSTQSNWLGITSPRDNISLEDYTAYLRFRVAPYSTVSYLWESGKKDILDPHNIVIKSLRKLGAEETVQIIAPRLAIYSWSLPDTTESR